MALYARNHWSVVTSEIFSNSSDSIRIQSVMHAHVHITLSYKGTLLNIYMPCPESLQTMETTCPKYKGWGCFITTVVIGLIVMLVLIGVGGPWYHDCDHHDCSTQQHYGIYCDDYCWTGQTGPGSTLAVFILAALFFVLTLPLCWNYTGRTARKYYEDSTPNIYIN